MRSLILSAAVALAVAATVEHARAQGNVGGTIGKKNKVVTGATERPAKRPAKHRVPSATPNTGPCRGLVGTWAWYMGLDAVFSVDRSVRALTYTGKWSCSGQSLVIVWDKINVIDRGTFSDNGTTLSIVNSRSERFIGKRK